MPEGSSAALSGLELIVGPMPRKVVYQKPLRNTNRAAHDGAQNSISARALFLARQAAQPESADCIFPFQLRQESGWIPARTQDEPVLRTFFFNPGLVNVGVTAVGQDFLIGQEIVRRHESRLEAGHVTPGGGGVAEKSVVEEFHVCLVEDAPLPRQPARQMRIIGCQVFGARGGRPAAVGVAGGGKENRDC